MQALRACTGCSRFFFFFFGKHLVHLSLTVDGKNRKKNPNVKTILSKIVFYFGIIYQVKIGGNSRGSTATIFYHPLTLTEKLGRQNYFRKNILSFRTSSHAVFSVDDNFFENIFNQFTSVDGKGEKLGRQNCFRKKLSSSEISSRK